MIFEAWEFRRRLKYLDEWKEVLKEKDDLDDPDDSFLDDHTASYVALLNQAEINALLNGMMDDDE